MDIAAIKILNTHIDSFKKLPFTPETEKEFELYKQKTSQVNTCLFVNELALLYKIEKNSSSICCFFVSSSIVNDDVTTIYVLVICYSYLLLLPLLLL